MCFSLKPEVEEMLRRGDVMGLVEALRNEDRDVRRSAARALGQIGDARAVEPLITALRDESWGVRRDAAKALGRIGDARAVEPLLGALRDEDSNVRREAAKALVTMYRSGRLGDAHRASILAQDAVITQILHNL